MVVFSFGATTTPRYLYGIHAEYIMSVQPVGTEEQRLKRRAMRRLAVGLALIALAIVVLALLDRYASAPKTASAPASPPVEPPPIATLPKPIQPAPGAQSATQAVPRLPPPPPPSVSNEPLAPVERPVPAKVVPAPANQAADIVPESTGGASKAPVKPAPRPSGEQPTTPASSKPTPSTAATSRYVVQLGVFTSIDNAQALQAKLKEQGIPTTLETRVIVGPFRERAEADAAREKLQALGISGLVARKK